MLFEEILNGILGQDGVEGIVFLDSEGETILVYGDPEHERLRLMGAYQAIVLSSACRLGMGSNRTVITKCGSKCILTNALKDGYFVCVLLTGDMNPAYVHFRFQDYFSVLENEL